MPEYYWHWIHQSLWSMV